VVSKKRSSRAKLAALPALPKAQTGIDGFDEISFGGIPRGRPTLICGAAGCGKTMLAAEILMRGILEFNEPGVFLMFEENALELSANMASLGFDIEGAVASNKLVVDHVHIDRREIEETGEYDLEGLFIRLQYAVEKVKAKRVVLDTLEALFSGFLDEAILRAELRRLFRWLKDRNLTAVITGERGEQSLTRYGLEEYVADCVVLLDHRVADQISTRRLRIVKYRGSAHGTNEYPFLIGNRGISVLPITSLTLDHIASTKRLSMGNEAIDLMLGGKGPYRGTSLLVSGSPGTGKSSIGAMFVDAACRRGERAVIFAYEESASQLMRNMKSIGVHLQPWIDQGLLHVHASRPTLYGLEQHLVQMHDTIMAHDPSVVLIDPMSNLTLAADGTGLKPTLMRLIDFLKAQGITALFTNLTHDSTEPVGYTDSGVSSLMDTWLVLSNLPERSERIRTIQILKSRGMSHSNQIREFTITEKGIVLVDVFMTDSGPITGRNRMREQQRGAASGILPDRIRGGSKKSAPKASLAKSDGARRT
jgi:circadian clock protein KaiC